MFRFLTVCLLALTLTTAWVPGQRVRSSLPASAKEALAEFDRVRGEDESVRQREVYKLGRFDDPQITKTLLAELDSAKTANYRRTLVSTLGQRQRDGILEKLLELFDAATDFSLRYSLASAIGRQGEAAVEPLKKRYHDLDPNDTSSRSLRGTILRALGDTKSPAAFDVLLDAAERAKDYDLYSIVQALKDAPRSERRTAILRGALASTYQPLKITAATYLLDEGDPQARGAALQLHKEFARSNATSHYRTQLAELLSRMLDKDTWQPFLVEAAAGYPRSEDLLKKVGKSIDEHVGMVEWLLKRGIRSKSPSERIVAVTLLTHSEAPGVSEALFKLVSAKDPSTSLLAIRALGERGDKQAVPFLRRALKAKDEARQIYALHGLHELLKTEPAWKEELRTLMRGSKLKQRVLALDLLAELQDESMLPEVHKLLTHKSWLVRAAAYDFCRLVRSLTSVEPLIARVDVEEGRLKEDCLDALKAITSYRMWSGDRWREWWSGAKATFEMPTLEQALPKKKRDSGAKTVSSFFDIPLVSTRVIFIIDVSGSMSAAIGTVSAKNENQRTRLMEAKRQLESVVKAIPDDAQFNLIYFETRVKAFAKASKRATKKTREAALKSVRALKPTGGTNIHDALELAFQDEDIDTIYLLSDGAPSAGKITDQNALAAEVARWNKTRRIRIHTIAIGSKSQLMEKLAADSGGEHSNVK